MAEGNVSLFAEHLAEELQDCGHDDISALDLLDALASCGLTLIPNANAAADAYQLKMLDPTEDS